jgi:hypothetical protein
VFLLGTLREWWREEREREGLLRLLLAEIEHNDEVASTIGETTRDVLSSPDFPSLTTETWRDLQGRASALLPDDLFAALNDYYSALQTLLTLLTFEDRSNQRVNREIRRMASELLEREFPASHNPWNEYLNATLGAQEKARAEIDAYLARPSVGSTPAPADGPVAGSCRTARAALERGGESGSGGVAAPRSTSSLGRRLPRSLRQLRASIQVHLYPDPLHLVEASYP